VARRKIELDPVTCYTGFKPKKELVFKHDYQVTVLTKKLRILMKIRI
jgi:hypothetical protein